MPLMLYAPYPQRCKMTLLACNLQEKSKPVLMLIGEEQSFLATSLGQAEPGEFATVEQVRAIWAKHGL